MLPLTVFSFRLLRLAFVIALLARSLPNSAMAEPSIVYPEDPVPIGGFVDVEISGLQNPQSLAWDINPPTRVRVSSAWGRPDDPILSIQSNANGKWLMAIAYVEDGKTVLKLIPLTVGTGPGPEPDPDPTPDPDPGPGPVPPGPSGLRGFILYETADSYPQHEDVLYSLTIRDYIKNNFAKGSDGTTPEFRLWDDDYNASHLVDFSEQWRNAYIDAKSRSGGVLPWLHISNGQQGFSGPLPDTVDKTLEIFNKFREN